MNFRKFITELSIPVTKALGKLHAPWTHRLTTAEDFYTLCEIARPGDILLATMWGEMSNLFIPGELKHAAMFVGTWGSTKHGVVHAIGAGVSFTDLVSFVMQRDRIVLMRPKFCNLDEQSHTAPWAVGQLGLPYDYYFEPGVKALYCAELVYHAYNKTLPDKMGFTLRKRLGVQTVIPDDFYLASKWFTVMFDNLIR